MFFRKNTLFSCRKAGKICTALGVKSFPGAEIILVGKAAGYDSLFIDMEHSTFTIRDVGQMCILAIEAGITPFVRVPVQCGSGEIQKILDAGAFGVVFPHINNIDDARAAVRASKYPPFGKRSVTGPLPTFGLQSPPVNELIAQANDESSTVIVMIETEEALKNVDEIAAEPGVDVILVGAMDLSTELNVTGVLDHPKLFTALEKVGNSVMQKGKIFGIAGLYHRPDVLRRVINDLGAAWVVGQNDIGLLLHAAKQNSASIQSMKN